VRALLDCGQIQMQLGFADQHPLIRDLSEYGVFINTPHP
jgi:hypothetical protein